MALTAMVQRWWQRTGQSQPEAAVPVIEDICACGYPRKQFVPLPVPRLELVWMQSQTTQQWRCIYRMVGIGPGAEGQVSDETWPGMIELMHETARAAPHIHGFAHLPPTLHIPGVLHQRCLRDALLFQVPAVLQCETLRAELVVDHDAQMRVYCTADEGE